MEFPGIFLCRDCGGLPRWPEVEPVEITLDYINRWTIRLNEQQVRQAWSEGQLKLRHIKREGYGDRFKPTESVGGELKNEVNSRGAEIAAALMTGLKLQPPIGEKGGADLGDCYQVRSTTFETGFLPIRECNFHRDFIYILVVGRIPRYRLAGWILGLDGATPERYHTEFQGIEEPFWKVQQAQLHPMEKLPR